MWPGLRALEAVPTLAHALDGKVSLLPVPADDPARTELLARTQRAGDPIDADVAIVACTSGSTGTPKGAMLTAANLRASIDATHSRLGGPGQWLLTTPPSHIAGLQVLLRTLRAGEVPVAMELSDGFRPSSLADAIAAMSGRRRYTSIVPLQLGRILGDAEATAALASLDGVLVGGQATSPELLRRARAAGVTVLTSYGSSETSGGTVYDGRPLDGADISIADGDSGRIVVSGPMVSRGYRNVDDPDLADGVFRTSDAGSFDHSGGTADSSDSSDPGGPGGGPVLRVLGRMDDVIISGGLKFLPGPIEDALTSLGDVAAAAVVGVPHPELGHAVVAAVTLHDADSPSPGATPPDPSAADTGAIEEHLRARLAPVLDKHQVPRAVFVVKQLPTLPSGKLDRTGLAATLAARWGMMSE
ncbi:AMP-binding protein [Corynebacterium xerosis]|uniref:AMP-binding protein n=2 Tax=Corynebacterium xerosis TaxID=1725 RepID=A0A7X9SWE2_9CORY|nr:o-succinylbenzoate--CoA ligase [Corynebacterium xerosis]NMF09088.1 AMP-binding protein [Corynebacterium xerosis]